MYLDHKRKYPEAIFVYIEEYNTLDKTVVFDFIDSNEHRDFANLLGLRFSYEKPSMVVLQGYHHRKIQENTIYTISYKTIQTWLTQEAITENQEDSFLLGYSINVFNISEEIFLKSISLSYLENSFFNTHMMGKSSFENDGATLKGKISITIRDVGQGNWNEIEFDGETRIVFDAGASMYATKSELRSIINNRTKEYAKSKPGLILSHWDKDHYHALIGMTDAELSCFSFFICRSLVPNYTSRILFNRIANSVGLSNTFSIRHLVSQNRGLPHLKPMFQIGALTLYNSSYHKNRNCSGLLAMIRTIGSSAILAGDAHYSQISQDILPALAYPNNHNLIVPHHGGNAGSFVYTLPKKVSPNYAIISVGKNSYGHPDKRITSSLRNTGFKVRSTNSSIGDRVIHL